MIRVRFIIVKSIGIKRIYDTPSDADGYRILIDRLWPRGLSKASAKVDYWAKSVAPTPELRKWYQHDPNKWDEFRSRYFAELDANSDGVSELLARLTNHQATFLFASRETRYNNAHALKEYVGMRTAT